MILACSYSLFPSIVTPSGARETVPEINNVSPTRKAFDHRPGGGSTTCGLVILSIFIVAPFLDPGVIRRVNPAAEFLLSNLLRKIQWIKKPINVSRAGAIGVGVFFTHLD
jgi:hypothetical protein